jgi:hypothetical protein
MTANRAPFMLPHRIAPEKPAALPATGGPSKRPVPKKANKAEDKSTNFSSVVPPSETGKKRPADSEAGTQKGYKQSRKSFSGELKNQDLTESFTGSANSSKCEPESLEKAAKSTASSGYQGYLQTSIPLEITTSRAPAKKGSEESQGKLTYTNANNSSIYVSQATRLDHNAQDAKSRLVCDAEVLDSEEHPLTSSPMSSNPSDDGPFNRDHMQQGVDDFRPGKDDGSGDQVSLPHLLGSC